MKRTLLMLAVATIAIVCLAMLAAEADATDYVVDENGNGDYTAIQDAINASSDGDTIYVWDGTYTENVVVNQSVTLIGNGTANTTIYAVGGPVCVYVASDWVNVTGFNISTDWVGVWGQANHTSVYGNLFYPISGTKTRTAVNLLNYPYAHISNNTILEGAVCFIEGVMAGNGCDWSRVEWNYIEGVRVGIALHRHSNSTASNNTIYDTSGRYSIGINVYLSEYHIIRDNYICGFDEGIGVTQVPLDYVIKHGTFINNTIVNISGNGIDLNWGLNNTIRDNTLMNCAYGVHMGTGVQNTFYHNIFINNTVHAYDGGSNTWNLSAPIGGNYWDTWTYPDVDGDGFVDNPYIIAGGGGGVDYLPLTIPYTPPIVVVAELEVPFESYWCQTITAYANDSLGADWYLWDWGDSTTSNTSVPEATHHYERPGEKTISLTVGNLTTGKTDTMSLLITVEFETTADMAEYTMITWQSLLVSVMSIFLLLLIVKKMLDFFQEGLEENR